MVMQHVGASIEGQRERWRAEGADRERRASDVARARAWASSSGGFGPFYEALAEGLEGQTESPFRAEYSCKSSQQNPQESNPRTGGCATEPAQQKIKVSNPETEAP